MIFGVAFGITCLFAYTKKAEKARVSCPDHNASINNLFLFYKRAGSIHRVIIISTINYNCNKPVRQAIAKRVETLYILAHISASQLQHLSAPPPPPLSMLYGFRDVNQSNKEQHWKGERGMWRANKPLISLQPAALTRKSDFPGEWLNNFANACSICLETLLAILTLFPLS